ncbi:hypothetical protein Landi51_07911 [Colletotrichum acutatum]
MPSPRYSHNRYPIHEILTHKKTILCRTKRNGLPLLANLKLLFSLLPHNSQRVRPGRPPDREGPIGSPALADDHVPHRPRKPLGVRRAIDEHHGDELGTEIIGETPKAYLRDRPVGGITSKWKGSPIREGETVVPVLMGLVEVEENKLSALLVKGETEVRVVEVVVLEKGGSLVVITVVDEEIPSLDTSDKTAAVVLLLVVLLIVVPVEELTVGLAVEVELVEVIPPVVEDVLVEVRLKTVVFIVLLSVLVRVPVAGAMLLIDEEEAVESVMCSSLELREDDGVEKFKDNVEEGESEGDDDVEDKVDNAEEGESEDDDDGDVEGKAEVDVNEEESKDEDVEDTVKDDVEEGESEVGDNAEEDVSEDDGEVEDKVDEVDEGKVEELVDVKVVSGDA